MSQDVLMIGSKARNGKDSLAEAIIENKALLGYDEVKIFKFAGALKQELADTKSIELHHKLVSGAISFWIDGEHFTDEMVKAHNVKMLLPMFRALEEQNAPFVTHIKSAGYLDENSVESYLFRDYDEAKYRADYPDMMVIAQWWGTEYRRKDNDNYWVDRAIDMIYSPNEGEGFLYNSDTSKLAILTDCRFENEFNMTIDNDGVGVGYVDVQRYKEYGSRYYDPSRDINHPSETGLDHIQKKNLIFNFHEDSYEVAKLRLFEKFYNLFREADFNMNTLGK